VVLLGWLILVIVIVVVLYLASLYNRLMTFRNRVDNAWAQVDVQLRRRYDVIPNLVETVKGYVSHEREVFENVARARQVAISAQGPQEKGAAENQLAQALRQLFAVAEAYPVLRASENFQNLQGGSLEPRTKLPMLGSSTMIRCTDTTPPSKNFQQTFLPALLVSPKEHTSPRRGKEGNRYRSSFEGSPRLTRKKPGLGFLVKNF